MTNLATRKEGGLGFTLVEILVALTIFSIIMAIVFAVYIQAQREMREDEERIGLEEYGQEILGRMSRELLGSAALIEGKETEIRFFDDKMEAIAYSVKERDLLRNGESLLKPGTELDSLRLGYYGEDPSLDMNLDGVVDLSELDLDGNGELSSEELTKVSLVEIRLQLTERAQKASVQTSVKLRNR